eukprot:CAMPEP_0185734872 /NCGR_PEP_ID=MMETSP1171-20130828/23664_1 /TAXON_ID=374046 /ORGANISM="Helicotheca tamensis, Strain CCMP826" /LENGTH=290 /DNA_ID=CAMNT_0028404991 /DNA_START=30 /DNA_END=902 /DNA_ORIENTATION=-
MDVPPGVATGNNLQRIYAHARENRYAIPAFHYTDSTTCNSILLAARKAGSPVAIRVTYATCVASCGKSNLTKDVPDVTVAEAVALALRVRTMAKCYGVPVILQSETRCFYRLKTWCDGLLGANKAYFDEHNEPLYSSHILDITAEVHDQREIIAICSNYLKHLDRVKLWLCLKTDYPLECAQTAHETLSKISGNFSIATSDFSKDSTTIPSSEQMFLILDESFVPRSDGNDQSKDHSSFIQVNIGGQKGSVKVQLKSDLTEEYNVVEQYADKVMERLNSKGQIVSRLARE